MCFLTVWTVYPDEGTKLEGVGPVIRSLCSHVIIEATELPWIFFSFLILHFTRTLPNLVQGFNRM